MTIEILINGEIYENLKEIKVTDALNSIAGSFEFSTSVQKLEDAGIKAYDNVLVRVDGEYVLQGYINPTSVSYDKKSHSLTTGGFGDLIDVVQCSVFANSEYPGPMDFGTFCIRVLRNNGFFGIKIIDKMDESDSSFSETEIASAKTGDKIFDFIKKYADVKNVLLSSDGLGNLVLYNNTGFETGITLTNQFGLNDNLFIKSGNSKTDMSKRYSEIIVKSQGGKDGFAGFAKGGDGLEDIEGFAIDSDVKRDRTLVIISKSAEDAKGCENQAIWEVNRRRAESIQYPITVKGHIAPNGEVWRAGMKVAILDTYANVKSIMLLNNVVYNESKSAGTTTNLTFIASDAYKLQAEDPNKNTNKVSGIL